ncbi:SMC-Scp complex subunit ScpB [Jonesia denitrificans]|uniref:Chromosome segregation and condensation protein, ScpB n=1 Tax=Jonesia denitrificans (strain ATCC 14870 / DSM 20603 / BCRC 15368 / CIP 55.134 / JCM 11481 / NBRC 15587 / NCTC 10816 / Prevot 55134) TaxID=471856 RepID=C7R468_JONDD|nr:SMC-Scp complex subunit ScpB [Jonesia denitrificans]ACV08925.1 chromosome segregation and condensation protein, ScpB [Jonesia denitrificans DSM 20603]ASE09766.1 SMC-Scp complex subunit ScpB [Jonesia denitrificans]QXB44302.1 SMC-Scp complex subunit ScpB [Jonesia denitrificans]SQH20984.1 Segregation and condensation protein B homolog [Jonesia denitrificans]
MADKLTVDPHILGGCEAVLMVADSPVTTHDFAEALGVSVEHVKDALTYLRDEYDGLHDGRTRGYQLRTTGAGWRIYSSAHYHDIVTHFVTAGKTARLSGAALETLAVIAYRQPVTRAAIQTIRGVSVDGVVRTLLSRELIEEVGSEPGTGASLYGTTATFLERMGLASLEELPHLAPALPDRQEMAELARTVEDYDHSDPGRSPLAGR